MYRTLIGDLQPRVVMAWLVLLVVALGGGSSWPNAASLLYVRPALIIAGIAAVVLYRNDMRGMRTFGLLLAALTGWIVIQLIPLPPVIWTRLPGHELIETISTAAGVSGVWRPISIAPDATLNSLMACIPALGALAVVSPLNSMTRRALVGALIVLVMASVVLGATQLASGGNGAFVLYRTTDEDTAVGVFANRNHYALLLAMGLPLLAAWSLGGRTDGEVRLAGGRVFMASLAALFVLVMIIATGSRAGLGLGVAGAVAGGTIFWRNREARLSSRLSRSSRRGLLIGAACLAVVLLVLGATIAFKGLAVERTFRTFSSLGAEQRAMFTPIMLGAIGLYFPFGSGFGTFDRLFRQIEPDWALGPTYFNHAHNEALELVLTGGLPAVLILLVFAVVLVRLSWQVTKRRAGPFAASAQAGIAAVVLALLASLVDYPLRTPLMDVVVVFALAIATTRESADRSRDRGRGSAVALDR